MLGTNRDYVHCFSFLSKLFHFFAFGESMSSHLSLCDFQSKSGDTTNFLRNRMVLGRRWVLNRNSKPNARNEGHYVVSHAFFCNLHQTLKFCKERT